MTFVLTSDLAAYLAAAVDADVAPGSRIDIGWDRPVSMHQIADISGRLLGGRVRVRSAPGRRPARCWQRPRGCRSLARDMSAMIDWFQTGRYVADTTRQQEVFGPPPTAEDAVARLLTELGHTIRK